VTVAQPIRTLALAAAAIFLLAACVPWGDPGAPGISQETHNRLSFSPDHPVEVRHVRVDVLAGPTAAHGWADAPIDTGGINGKRPVELTVTRDRDGASINNDFGPDYQAGLLGSLAGQFDMLDCPAGGTCSETFTLTFRRIPQDTRPCLAFDWSVRARLEYPSLDPFASVPPGGSLAVSITR
jgi:hypothetical protein